MTQVSVAIGWAEQHIGKGGMVSSAQVCLDDARALAAKGDDAAALKRAGKSLGYSVGYYHEHAKIVVAWARAAAVRS